MEAEQNHPDEVTPDAKKGADNQAKMGRREALAIVGKHAVYTAPAVLAILAAVKPTRANAATGG